MFRKGTSLLLNVHFPWNLIRTNWTMLFVCWLCFRPTSVYFTIRHLPATVLSNRRGLESCHFLTAWYCIPCYSCHVILLFKQDYTIFKIVILGAILWLTVFNRKNKNPRLYWDSTLHIHEVHSETLTCISKPGQCCCLYHMYNYSIQHNCIFLTNQSVWNNHAFIPWWQNCLIAEIICEHSDCNLNLYH